MLSGSTAPRPLPACQPGALPGGPSPPYFIYSGPSCSSGPLGSDGSGGGGREQEGPRVSGIDTEDVLAAADTDPLLPGAHGSPEPHCAPLR